MYKERATWAGPAKYSNTCFSKKIIVRKLTPFAAEIIKEDWEPTTCFNHIYTFSSYTDPWHDTCIPGSGVPRVLCAVDELSKWRPPCIFIILKFFYKKQTLSNPYYIESSYNLYWKYEIPAFIAHRHVFSNHSQCAYTQFELMLWNWKKLHTNYIFHEYMIVYTAGNFLHFLSTVLLFYIILTTHLHVMLRNWKEWILNYIIHADTVENFAISAILFHSQNQWKKKPTNSNYVKYF